ncbi:response regulator transcription factor [Pantoea endophytica]|uniref:DNA-binding response regulator n=1 Tax=Pantoea endophytica TaxID=92488 RepID=A0ABX4SVI0_9GAMM|nr:response regulator transcription factor [Pantoea endophytica]PLR26444.1 DNA-binding response regulator [Pantoea endophytica]
MTITTSPIRLVILDDHPIFLRSFDVLCAGEQGLTIVGKFQHSRELINWLRTSHCDVLVLDYILQNDEMDGLSLIKHLLLHFPYLRILLSTSVDSLAVIRAAYMLGVRGYLSKREEAATYVSAIRTLANGQRYVPQHIAEGLTQVPLRKNDEEIAHGIYLPQGEALMPVKLLTPREAEVVNCYMEGMEIPEIAAKLKRSRKTVSGHKQSAMKKLGICSDLELFKYRKDLFK